MASVETEQRQVSEKIPEHVARAAAPESNTTLTVTSPEAQSDPIMRDENQPRNIGDAPPSYTSEKPYVDYLAIMGLSLNVDRDMTLVTAQPGAVDGMTSRPAEPAQESGAQHRVLRRLEDLGETPDYIDCPHCKTRQKTRVEHPSSSATTYVFSPRCALVLEFSLARYTPLTMDSPGHLTDHDIHSFSALFCCLCCGVITVCIPFLCNWFAETDHHCTKCGELVAHKPHDGIMEARLPPPTKTEKYGESQFKEMSPEERQNLEGGK